MVKYMSSQGSGLTSKKDDTPKIMMMMMLVLVLVLVIERLRGKRNGRRT